MVIVENVIKSLVESGAFGDVVYVNATVDDGRDAGDQFASIIRFSEVTVNDGLNDIKYPLVVKQSHDDENLKNVFNSIALFKNETLMYNKVLPFLKADERNLFPKMLQAIYIDDEDINQDVLILEDLGPQGFQLTKERLFLDFDHLALALKKLGEFHALSHLAKKREGFSETVSKLIETKFNPKLIELQGHTIYLSMERGIKPLINEGVGTEILTEVLQRIHKMNEVVSSLMNIEEPFSVVCHGDFCRNNIFFKYDNIDHPVDVKFFDLQTSLYGTPAIDLAFFLYLNTSAEMRNHRWDQLLQIYWESLSENAPNIDFTYSQFLEHFAKRAMYGLFPTSFFLPVMMEKIQLPFEDYMALPQEERIKIILNCGGYKATRALIEIVRHLLEMKYFEKFLTM